MLAGAAKRPPEDCPRTGRGLAEDWPRSSPGAPIGLAVGWRSLELEPAAVLDPDPSLVISGLARAQIPRTQREF